MKSWHMRHRMAGVALLSIASLMGVDQPTAIESISQQIKKSPDDADLYLRRAQLYSADGKHDLAVNDLNEAIRLSPDTIRWVDFRGSEQLLNGNFKQALADFDQFLAKHPDQAPYHWKRGIALYYAGRYDDGVKQFDIHQTVNSADVENAVWRFLCMAKRNSADAAKKDLLKIGPDSRVPMSQVYDLFAGKATIEDVLAAARAGNPDEEQLQVRLFYAHLYIGLYLDALGKSDAALEHMELATKDFLVNDYMGGIAVVHLAEHAKASKKERP